MKKIILLLSLLPLAACTQSYEDLTQWMTQTRQEAKSKIIPFEEPTVTLPKPYSPPNFKGMNAFDSRRLDTAPKGGNAPDVNRPKETWKPSVWKTWPLSERCKAAAKFPDLLRSTTMFIPFIPETTSVRITAESKVLPKIKLS